MGNTTGIPIYCINLAISKDRKRTMQRRFKLAHLKKVKFVKAIHWESDAVQFYAKGAQSWYQSETQWRKDLAWYGSHLLAIKRFLRSGKSEGIICEDDILLCDGFSERLNALKAKLPPDYKLLTLTYMITDPITTPLSEGLFPMPPAENSPIWGVRIPKGIPLES